MLAWMRAFREMQPIGIESTGSYGAGLLRFMQQAKVTVLEVTTPDKQDRRRRCKNDDLDAQNAAHAAFAGQRYRSIEPIRGRRTTSLADSPKGIPNSTPFEPSSVTLPERSSRSSRSAKEMNATRIAA